MLHELPNADAAAEEAAAWGSTEDDDFVTPWYTYAMRALMFPLGFLIFYFIFWRMYNFPRSHVWWSDGGAYIFIFSEAICFLFGMTHWVWMWNLKFRKRVTQQQLNLRDEDLPTVDIMIPCYSEPTEIVEMTLKACYDMDYPSEKITCWVCDDGKTDDMRNMVSRAAAQYKGKMKTKYVARIKIKGVPHHAKAGNLNNCILKEPSNGQLIIILDCDMLPGNTGLSSAPPRLMLHASLAVCTAARLARPAILILSPVHVCIMLLLLLLERRALHGQDCGAFLLQEDASTAQR